MVYADSHGFHRGGHFSAGFRYNPDGMRDLTFDDSRRRLAYARNIRYLEQEMKKPNLVAYAANWARMVAPRPGLEPGTCGLTVRRSTD
jgi:hypothetical protein